MRKEKLPFWLGVAISVMGGSAACATAPAVEARLAQQNALFEEQYESDLRAHPELATAYGDYRYNDQLNDYSVAGSTAQHERDADFLARLQRISVAGFPEQDAMSHQVLQRVLEQRIANFDFARWLNHFTNYRPVEPCHVVRDVWRFKWWCLVIERN